MRSGLVVLVCLVAGCSGAPRRMALQRVILYQNGIGYFERTGQVGGDRILLPFSRHELDDVIKTLTVIDRRGAGVATVEVPVLRDKDTQVTLGVRMTGGGAHDVAVSYAARTPTICAPAIPRTRMASRTTTAAPSPTTTRIGSPIAPTSARTIPRPTTG